MADRRGVAITVMVVVAVLLMSAPASGSAQGQSRPSAAEINDELGVGVNLGNALEAEREGVWGVTLDADYFTEIAAAGFGHVRVPIKWSAYADDRPPFTIAQDDDPTIPYATNIWERVDWVIAQAEDAGLYVVVNMHHYDELHDDPDGHRNRFLAMWGQIATRYADAGPMVLFELLNEPNGAFNENPALWNELFADALAIVRQTNPDRPVLAAPVEWNGIAALDDLVLPDDPNLIVSVHFYEPFWFTHQGAEWNDPVPPAPVSWDPDVVDIGAGWENWSWDIAWTPTTGGAAVTFSRQWSGMQFERGSELDPVSIDFTVSGVAELDLRCTHTDGDATDIVTVTTNPGTTTYSFDLHECPSETSRLVLMNSGAEFEQLLLTDVMVCSTNFGCEQVIQRAQDKVHAALDRAAAWGELHDHPINIGEFGAYSAGGRADVTQRAVWTTIVRTRASELNMSMTYWEFGAGFGVYDRTTNRWIEPLLTALLPDVFATGDVNCDGRIDRADAAAAAQMAAGLRGDGGACPVDDPRRQGSGIAADVDADGSVTIADAVIISQCATEADDRGLRATEVLCTL